MWPPTPVRPEPVEGPPPRRRSCGGRNPEAADSVRPEPNRLPVFPAHGDLCVTPERHRHTGGGRYPGHPPRAVIAPPTRLTPLPNGGYALTKGLRRREPRTPSPFPRERGKAGMGGRCPTPPPITLYTTRFRFRQKGRISVGHRPESAAATHAALVTTSGLSISYTARYLGDPSSAR